MANRPLGRVALALLFAALVGVVLTYKPAQLAAPEERADRSAVAQDVQASGYNAIINRLFVPSGWLELDASGDPNAPVVTLSAAAREHEAIQAFYRDSFLKADIESNDPGLWRMENGRVVGILDDAHAIRLPFAQHAAWRGDLDFRDPGERLVRLSTNGSTVLLSPLVGRPGAVPEARVEVFAPPTAPVDAGGVQLVRLFSGAREVGKLFRMGDGPPILRLESASVRVVIDGAVLQVAEAEAAYARLDPGAQVLIERTSDGAQTALAVSAHVIGLSRRHVLGGRRRDPAAEGLAQAIERAMSGAVASRALAPDLRLVSTLDAETQALMQDRLERFCERGRAVLQDPRPFRAAITVMDLSSGELLALASYPRTLAQTGSPSSRRSADLRLIETNHNFARLNIGSTAKPLFASAILQRFPEMRGLTIPGRYPKDRMDELFGVALNPTIEEHSVNADQVDFPTFLAASDNRYAAMLMLLGASPQPFQDGPIASGPFNLGRPRTRLPPLVFDHRLGPDGWALLTPRDSNFASLISDPAAAGGTRRYSNWPGWMRDLYDLPLVDSVAAADARADRGPALLGGSAYDLGIWRQLADRTEGRGLDGFRTSQVSPERERLGLNVITDFRGEYLNLILGGGRSQWTTVKLAESYGRIVSGRRVRPTLLRQVGSQPAPHIVPEPLAWDPAVQGALLQGMARVTDNGGTAASRTMSANLDRLRAEAARRGDGFAIYSKTGTPTLETASGSAVGRAVEELFARRILRMVSDGQFAGVAGGLGALVTPRDARSRADAAAALERLAAGAEVLRLHRVRAEAVAAHLERFNRATTAAEKRRWLRFSGGAVLVPTRADTKGQGRSYVFVLVRNANSGAPPQGLVVAINIQQSWSVGAAEGRGDLPNHVAAALGTQLLQGDLDRALWLDQAQSVGSTASP